MEKNTYVLSTILKRREYEAWGNTCVNKMLQNSKKDSTLYVYEDPCHHSNGNVAHTTTEHHHRKHRFCILESNP